MSASMITCGTCKEPKAENAFPSFRRNGKTYRRKSYCKKCAATYHRTRWPKIAAQRNERWSQRQREMRQRNEEVGRWILVDTRKNDKRNGRQNDLTREFVDALIKDGCIYCGATQLRMTLDRIDNSKGHTMENVTPACIRCNYARGAMPYAAWLCLADGMRAAREKGLFGNWTGSLRKRKPT